MIPAGTSAMRPAFPAPAETLAAWLRGVAPAGTASAGSFIRTAAPAFDEWEAAPVSGAVPMRQAEYLTGRSLARAALASLGCPPSSIPADAERVPVWPMGYLGSISHADGLCIAHVGRTASLTGIGIDFERAGAVPAAIGSDLMSCPEALSSSRRSMTPSTCRRSPLSSRRPSSRPSSRPTAFSSDSPTSSRVSPDAPGGSMCAPQRRICGGCGREPGAFPESGPISSPRLGRGVLGELRHPGGKILTAPAEA